MQTTSEPSGNIPDESQESDESARELQGEESDEEHCGGTVIDPHDSPFQGLDDLKKELGPKEFLRRYEEFLKNNQSGE